MKFKSATNPIVFAILITIAAATARSLHAPLTKLVSAETGTLMSLAFICFGVGVGMLLILSFGRKSKAVFDPKRHLQRKDAWKIVSLILLSFLANTLIIIGLKQETAAAGSILQNVSTVATVIFAALFLHEKIPKRLGIGAGLIVLGSFALSITNAVSLSFSTGSLFLIGGNIALGASYIVTKLLSERNPIENVICRGFGVSILAFIIAVSLGESLPTVQTAIGLMAVGFLSSGLSTMLLQYGQRHLGAAKAGVIYGTAPVLGVLFAIPLLGEIPSAAFIAALILFIPGMYFVITKNNTAAAKQKNDDPSDEEDTRFFASITERRKTDMRNILTSFGLLAIALYFVMMMLDMFDSGTVDAALKTLPTYLPGIALGIFTLLCGVILLLLGRRVMAAVTFMIMAMEMLSAAVLNGIVMMNVISGIFGILFAIILMTSKDPQKYAFAIINVLLGFASISCLFNEKVCGWIMAVAAVYLIWLSIACGTEKLRYSIAKYLTKDGDMTFRKCGPVIGYLLISVLLSTTLVYAYADMPYFPHSDSGLFLELIAYGMLIFVGLMLMIIGKRKMTSIVFISCGLAFSLYMISSGVFLYLPAVLLLVVGIMNIIWKDERVLPSILLFGNAFMLILSSQMTVFPEVMVAMLILTLICAGISLYLAFAVFSDKPKLPLF